MSANHVPVLLSHSNLTILTLSAIKVDLVDDFPGAMMRYQLALPVANIIVSLAPEEIELIAQQSSVQNVLRVAHGDTPSFWSDLKKAAANKDRTAVSLSLVQSILTGVPQPSAA